MWTQSFVQLARYNQWANEKLLAHVGKLGADSYKAHREMFGGSIDGVLHHLFIADGLTMATLTADMLGFRPRNRLGEEILIESMVQCLYPEFLEFRTARSHLDRQIVEYATTLSEGELTEPLSYFDLHGERHKLRRWQLLTELFTHQQHHRGQLTAILHGLHRPLGRMDYSSYLRAEGDALL